MTESTGCDDAADYAVCALCGKRGAFPKCSACHAVHYCCREHQRKHRFQHRARCEWNQRAQQHSGAGKSNIQQVLQTSTPRTPLAHEREVGPTRHRPAAVGAKGSTHINELPRAALLRIIQQLAPQRVASCGPAQPPLVSRDFGSAFEPFYGADKLHHGRVPHVLMQSYQQEVQPVCDAFCQPHRRSWRELQQQTRDLFAVALVCRLWRSIVREDDLIRGLAVVGRPVNCARNTKQLRGAEGSNELPEKLMESFSNNVGPLPSVRAESLYFVDTSFVPFEITPEGTRQTFDRAACTAHTHVSRYLPRCASALSLFWWLSSTQSLRSGSDIPHSTRCC